MAKRYPLMAGSPEIYGIKSKVRSLYKPVYITNGSKAISEQTKRIAEGQNNIHVILEIALSVQKDNISPVFTIPPLFLLLFDKKRQASGSHQAMLKDCCCYSQQTRIGGLQGKYFTPVLSLQLILVFFFNQPMIHFQINKHAHIFLFFLFVLNAHIFNDSKFLYYHTS